MGWGKWLRIMGSDHTTVERYYPMVFCDLDGTLLKPNGAALEQTKEILSGRGIHARDIKVEPNGIDSIRTLYTDDFDAAKKVYNNLLRTGKYTPEPTEGAVAAMKFIRDNGIDFALLTNGDQEAAGIMFDQRFGFTPEIVGEADKPGTEKAIEFALGKGILPAANSLVHVGDSIGTDIRAALNNGF